MSQSRRTLLGFAAGGIILYTWALISIGVIIPSLIRIIALIVSVVLMAALIIAFGRALAKTIRISNSWKSAAVTGLLFIATFFVITFVFDWGVGANIRALPFWSFLPKGNLLVAGGRAGVTYLVLFGMLTASLLWGKVKKVGGEKPPTEPKQRKEREKAPKSNQSEILTDREEIANFLTPR